MRAARGPSISASALTGARRSASHCHSVRYADRRVPGGVAVGGPELSAGRQHRGNARRFVIGCTIGTDATTTHTGRVRSYVNDGMFLRAGKLSLRATLPILAMSRTRRSMILSLPERPRFDKHHGRYRGQYLCGDQRLKAQLDAVYQFLGDSSGLWRSARCNQRSTQRDARSEAGDWGGIPHRFLSGGHALSCR